MYRRFVSVLVVTLALTAMLAACGGAAATNTPLPPTPTVAPPTPTTAPPTAAPTIAPTIAPTTAPTTAPSTAVAASPTRPAGSATVGTAAAGTTTTGITTTGTTAAGSTTAGAGLTTFTDPQGRFSFSRPAAWMQQANSPSDVLVQFNATNPLLSVNIVVTPLPVTISPDQYLPLVLDQLKKSIPDATLVGTTQTPIGGEQGTQVDYTGTTSGTKVAFSQIFVIHKNTAYVLTLASQPADIDRAKQQAVVVVQTWKFLN